jgi:uncharacterized repeat protein (TIGR01451 family)
VGGRSYARFRLSSAGGLAPTGTAADGEVEDYAVTLSQVDFGDAPDSYGTTLAHGGPYHRIVPGYSLGPTVTAEPDGQPSVGAGADAGDDGVTLPAAGFPTCHSVSFPVSLTNTAGIATPLLDAWIDWDGDGVFNDPRDRVATAQPLASGSNTLTVQVPCDARGKQTYARFRLSSTGVSGPGGQAADGEVEDYPVLVQQPSIGLAKQLVSITTDPANALAFEVTFTLRLANMGNVPLTNVNAVDHLATTFPPPLSYTVTSLSSADFTVNGSYDGNANANLLAGGNSLALAQTGAIQLVVHVVSAGRPGPYTNVATASAASAAGVPVTDTSQDGADPDPDHDGNPGNNSDPTVIVLPVAIALIPTLDPWGLAALALLLGLLGWKAMRRPARVD